ncbi:MAG: M12 family metallo-peptidase [Opitutales bacterium]
MPPVIARFPLADGTSARVQFLRSQRIQQGQFDGVQWQGQIEGIEYSSVNYTHWKGAVFASVYAGAAGTYEWRGKPGDVKAYEVTSEQIMECVASDADDATNKGLLSGIVHSSAKRDTKIQSVNAEGSASTVIDVLICYTQAAADEFGGNSILEAKIWTAVGDANTAFSNSGVDMTMSAYVHLLENYDRDPDLSFDDELLESLEDASDPGLVEFGDLRESYEADFACLWLNNNLNGGKANVLTLAIARYAPESAVSVVRARNPTSTFVHEIGHNMGCRHLRDSYSGTPSSWDSYSFAHIFDGSDENRYVTVMSSTTNASNEGATRVLYFSNPEVLLEGEATGVADLSNCALTLQNNRLTYAGFWGAVPFFAEPDEVLLGPAGEGETIELFFAYVLENGQIEPWETDWLSIPDPVFSGSEVPLTVAAAPNLTDTVRSGQVRISAEGVSDIYVKVTQTENLGITLNESFIGGSFFEGANVSFFADAIAVGDLSYQWYLNDEVLVGETDSKLTIARLGESETGVYKLVVTHAVDMLELSGELVSYANEPLENLFSEIYEFEESSSGEGYTGTAETPTQWSFVDWFGLMETSNYPWVYHQSMSWILLQAADESESNSERTWIWFPNTDEWYLFSDSTDPWVWSDDAQAWHYLYQMSGVSWVYDYNTRSWNRLAE